MNISRLINLILMSALSHGGKVMSYDHGAVSSQFVPWSKYHQQGDEFRIDVTINGMHHRGIVVDTGSTGFLVGAKYLGYHDDSKLKNHYEKAFQYLSSSRRYYEGYWLPVELTFKSHLEQEIHSQVPIFLVVQQGRCGRWDGRNCTDRTEINNFDQINTFYMGVGFGRWSHEQPNSTVDKNPFLNVKFDANNNSLRNGYHLNTHGVVLGITSSDLIDGWKTVQLTRNTESAGSRPEWCGTPMCVTVNDSECFLGTALFDSGLGDGYLGVASGVTEHIKKKWKDGKIDRYIIIDGVIVTLKIGPPGQEIAMYSFKVGDYSQRPQMTPYRLRVSKPHGSQAFVNTARAFFNGFELIFDENSGVVGIKEKVSLTKTTLLELSGAQKPILAGL